MLDKNALKSTMLSVIQGGSFPANASHLSAAIAAYVQANGTPTPPTISYTLSPKSGLGWEALIPLAISSGKGIGDKIISVALATEFAASIKVVPAPHGTQTLPMNFNRGANVGDLSNEDDYNKVWERIAEAIIEFFKPEIK